MPKPKRRPWPPRMRRPVQYHEPLTVVAYLEGVSICVDCKADGCHIGDRCADCHERLQTYGDGNG